MEYWSVGVVSLRKLLCTHGTFLCSRFAVRSVASPRATAPGKILRKRTGERLFEPTFARGCSSVVEHLLANEYRSNDPKLSNAICSARAQVNPAIHVILTLSETL